MNAYMIFLCFILSSDSKIVGSIVNDLDVETLSISLANKLKVEVRVNQFNQVVFIPLFLPSLQDLVASARYDYSSILQEDKNKEGVEEQNEDEDMESPDIMNDEDEL